MTDPALSPPPIWFEPPPRPSNVPLAPPRAGAAARRGWRSTARRSRSRRARRCSTPAAPPAIDMPTLCFLETLTPVERLPRLRGRGRGRARARAGLLAQGRGGHEGQNRLRARAPVAQAGARAARLVGRPLDRARARRADGATTAPKPARFGAARATVAQPAKVDNELYVRDYGEVRALLQVRRGLRRRRPEHLRHRGRRPRLRRPHLDRVRRAAARPRPASTAATASRSARPARSWPKPEFDLRQTGEWHEESQTRTDTICPYCGVGCTLTLHVQDERIVKVTSPLENAVTHGNLCVKGRFGFEFVHGPRE